MREIKFRVWNLILKEWTPVGILATSLGEFLLNEEAKKRVIVQQFTGLKDKNGKEIYEGDIIQAGINKERFKVVFGMAQFYLTNNDEVYTMEAFEFIGDYSEHNKLLQLEVIGNIFENPELDLSRQVS